MSGLREIENRRGIDSAHYFSPHVAEQEYFRRRANLVSMPVTNDVASRVLTLPLFDAMTDDEVLEVGFRRQGRARYDPNRTIEAFR
jgi:dTDP-4-amino-4,6-dideoxygalactose transaminase